MNNLNMKNVIIKNAIYLFLAFVLLTVNAQASDAKLSLVVSNAWIRLMPPVATSTAAYFVLENKSDKAIEIINVSTVIAKKSSLHDIEMKNDMATMVPIKALIIPSDKKVIFSPGGKHLMIMGLTEKLAENKEVLLDFELKNGETITVTLMVYKNNPLTEETEKSSMQHKH